MLGLSTLAGWEEAVLASVRGASGTPDERDAQIERSGLYGEYPAIVSGYIEHFSVAESALEALRRAYFLVWRGAMAAPASASCTGVTSASSSTSWTHGAAAVRPTPNYGGCSAITTH